MAIHTANTGTTPRPFSTLHRTQRVEGRDGVRWLQVRLRAVAGEPGVGLEHPRIGAAHADDDARVVAGAAEEEREHGSAAQAAVAPDPPAAVQDPIDVEGQERRSCLLYTSPSPRDGLLSR